MNTDITHVLLDFGSILFYACSYRTPKSFACLRCLVTHDIKVYKFVNYRKIYHIDISHCCTDFCELSEMTFVFLGPCLNQ